MSKIASFKKITNNTRLKAWTIAGSFIMAISSIAAAATITAASAAPVSTPNCDDNAVVICGATSVSQLQQKYNNKNGVSYGSIKESQATIHNIYNYSKFAISSSDISSMSSQAVSGYVTKGGDVYAGGKLVATDALTAGRTNYSGSTKVTSNGTTFYTRKPIVSFKDDELSAMVDMKNGTFQFAILNSCGNPVTATPKKTPMPTPTPTPTPKPSFTINKQVRAGTTGSYSSDVSVKAGSEVEYQITVNVAGTGSVNNLTVHDTLPSGVTYKTGTLQYNGANVLASNVSSFFGTGLNIGTRKSGDKVVYTFDATAGTASADASSCQEDTLTNTGFANVTGLTGQQSSATVKTTCTPPKQNGFTYTCNKFTVGVDNITRKVTVTEFDATSDNPNAKLTNVVVDWGDGSTNTVTADQATSQAHIFTADSSTITATGQFTVNGETTPVNSTSCTQPVSFTTTQSTPTPPTPTLPNTGAGDTIALFMGAIVAGTIGFRMFMIRKMGRR